MKARATETVTAPAPKAGKAAPEADVRPDWPFATDIAIAQWLADHPVRQITNHMEMTGADTSKEWIVFHDGKSQSPRYTQRFDSRSWNNEFKVMLGWPSLVRMETRLRERLDAIKKWDAKHQAERATYERLKKKFAPGPEEGTQP